MLWLSWRQFRAQAAAGVVVTLAGVAYLVHVGLGLRDQHQAVLDHCRPAGTCAAELAQLAAQQENRLLFLAAGLYVVPFLAGMFWGAPLVSTELEHGTHRFVWNQSVTRTRWLWGRVLLPLGAAGLLMAALSAAMTWAAAPVDGIADNAFEALLFGARDLAPVGYGVLAVALGVLAGTVTRRRLPAMAVCAAVFLAVQVGVPNLVRPHYLPVRTESRPMTVEAINAARSLGTITGASRVGGLRVDDGWVSSSSDLLTASGEPLPSQEFDRCYSDAPETGAEGRFGDVAVCLARLDLHVDLEYQPDDRYWTFQVVELLLFLLSAGLAVTGAGWWIRRRIT